MGDWIFPASYGPLLSVLFCCFSGHCGSFFRFYFCQIQHSVIGQIEDGIIQQAVLTVLVTCLAGGIYNYRDVWKEMWIKYMY
ncbi:hypothetical protein AB205_0084430 [Aquarana catesbeiana]|uniref:Uncharacterized protein n=1 Tax=Aquarana catesbeiana TaxID=8400 RepID=A0A2G9SEL0_AQUCT|nr:hypothetical protein AB205_0084430 [Aquarana catesbeiana]